MSEWRRIARFNEELHGWMRDVLSALHAHVVLGYQKSTSDGLRVFLGEEGPKRNAEQSGDCSARAARLVGSLWTGLVFYFVCALSRLFRGLVDRLLRSVFYLVPCFLCGLLGRVARVTGSVFGSASRIFHVLLRALRILCNGDAAQQPEQQRSCESAPA